MGGKSYMQVKTVSNKSSASFEFDSLGRMQLRIVDFSPF
jgi:hypothetical protein